METRRAWVSFNALDVSLRYWAIIRSISRTADDRMILQAVHWFRGHRGALVLAVLQYLSRSAESICGRITSLQWLVCWVMSFRNGFHGPQISYAVRIVHFAVLGRFLACAI